MELYYKITAGVLLLLHCFHTGLLQLDPAENDPPGFTPEDDSWYPDSDGGDYTDRYGNTTIPLSWLRVGKQGNARAEEGEPAQEENMESSGEMAAAASVSSGEGDADTAGLDQEANGDNATVLSTVLTVFSNDTVTAAETTTAPPTTTTSPAELTNETGLEEEEGLSPGSTTSPPPTTTTTTTTTGFPDLSNDTDLNDAVTADATPPEANITRHQAGTAGPESNATENATDAMPTTTEVPPMNAETTTTDLPPPPPETTVTEDASNETTTAAAVPDETPEASNMTLDAQASGSNSERGNAGGLASDSEASGKRSRKSEAWSAILGTGVAVAFVGMVVYVVVRKRNQRDFSHRKLVEEFPSDPDNSEPLDLNFGGSAYYNRAMQADDIQMNSFPGAQQR